MQEEKKKYYVSLFLGFIVVMGFTILFELFGKNPIIQNVVGPICICSLFTCACIVVFLGSGIGQTTCSNGTEMMYVKYYPRITGFSMGILLLTLAVLIFYVIVKNAIAAA